MRPTLLALHAGLCCSAAALRAAAPSRRGVPDKPGKPELPEIESLFFIEKASLDPRCFRPYDDPGRCAPPRVFVWGQMVARLEAHIVGCGTSALGNGTLELVPFGIGFVNKGWAFQVVCHFDSLGRSAPAASGAALPAQPGSVELFVEFDEKQTKVLGPKVEEAASWSASPPAGDGTIGSCLGVMFGRPMFVRAWLVHQIELGVDGVHMYTQPADRNGISPELKEVIANVSKEAAVGVELQEWPVAPWGKLTPFGDYAGQDSALTHCVVRNAPAYRWMLISDSDEFLAISPPHPSLKAFVASRERLWDEAPKLEVDTIVIQRDAMSGTPGDAQQCKDKAYVLPKGIVGTGRVLRMSPHAAYRVYDTASLTPTDPVSFTVPPQAMRFAHFAHGAKGCREEGAKLFLRGAQSGQRWARSSEDDEPDACLATYGRALNDLRRDLGSELLALWGAAAAREAIAAASEVRKVPFVSAAQARVVLELGAGGAASAQAVVQAASQLRLGTARRLPRLPRAGGPLDCEAGQRFLLRLLGWDDAATWTRARALGCHAAVRRLATGGAEGLAAPPWLQALLAELPPEPSALDASVAVVIAQRPTAAAMRWQDERNAVTEWSPEALSLANSCGRRSAPYGQVELAALHNAHLGLMECMAPDVPVVDIVPNITEEHLSKALTALVENLPGQWRVL